MKKTIYILLVSFFIYSSQGKVYSQSNKQLAKDYLAKSLLYKDYTELKSLELVSKGVFYAEKQNDKHLLADLYYLKAKIFDFNQKYDSSLVYYKLAAPIFLQKSDSGLSAKCYNNIGATEYYYGDFINAKKSLNKALYLLSDTNQSALQAKLNNNLGLINKSLGDYNTAVLCFHKSLDIKKKNGDFVGTANTYQNIGIVYWEQGNYSEAINCYNESINLLKTDEPNLKKDLGDAYSNIGLIYSDQNNFRKAIEYYDKSLSFYQDIDDKQGVASIYLNKGAIKKQNENFEKAEDLFIKSLSLFEEVGYLSGILNSKINLSEIYSLKGESEKAISYVLDVLKIDKKHISKKDLLNEYLILSDNYSKMKNYKKAFFYLDKYSEIRTNIFNLEKNKQLNDIRTKYETEKKEAQIVIIKQDNKIKSLDLEQKSKQYKMALLIIVIVLIFLIIASVLYFQKRKSYLLLVEQNVKLTKAEILNEESINESVYAKENNQKSSSTSLDDNQKQRILEDLIYLMEKEKYFLNPQFTINDFAKEIDTNRNYISQIINEKFQTNFNNFVNEYRIKEARKLLISPEYKKYSIEGVASTVGFHSKATFNSAFKKFTGVTPSFFRNNSNIE